MSQLQLGALEVQIEVGTTLLPLSVLEFQNQISRSPNPNLQSTGSK